MHSGINFSLKREHEKGTLGCGGGGCGHCHGTMWEGGRKEGDNKCTDTSPPKTFF
jgi:hypothetical protein